MDPPVRVLYVEGVVGLADRARDAFEGARTTFDVGVAPDVGTAQDRLDSAPADCLVVECGDRRGPGETLLDRLDGGFDRPVVALVDGEPAAASAARSAGATDHVYATEVEDSADLLVSCVRDAVERHEGLAELGKYRSLVDTVGDPMYVLDPDGTARFANDAMAQMLGVDRSSLVGSHATAFMSEGDFDRGTALIVDILEDDDREWGTLEVTIEPTAGEPIPAEINVAPILDGTRSYGATVGVVRDVSTRKRRERRLVALHDTTRRLIEAPDVGAAVEIGIAAAADVLDLEIAAFFGPTPDGDALVCTAATDRVAELLEEVPTFERGEGLIWDAYEEDEAIFANDVGDETGAYNPDTPIGSEMLIPAGDHGVFVASSTETRGFDAADEELAGVLVSNLTRAIDSVRREDRLRDRERELEQFETMIQAIPDEVYTLDADGRFTSIVPPTHHVKTTTGFRPDELIGEPVTILMDDADIEAGESVIRDLLADDDRDRASFEMEVITRDGDRLPRENHVALLPTGENGEFRGTVGVLRDITERRERERELRRQNERLEQFAHIASHDLRNPLNVAEGRLTLAEEECDSDHLDEARAALDRMETLIDDTLTIAKEGRSVTRVSAVDLSDLATRSWDAVPGADATLEVRDEVAVSGDCERLSRVLENLFRNALEHGGGDVRVAFGAIDDEGFYVADDGPGIPPEQRSAIFEAGHSTAADGTGFGLAIVQEILDAHGWTIEVRESEWGGARFDVCGVDLV